MSKAQFITNQEVQASIEAAAAKACEVLDAQFPGSDAGGITSNFQGLLVQALTHMLKGGSLLDGVRGHSTYLPQLVISEAFFGNPLMHGDAFLVRKPVKAAWGELEPVMVLNPDGHSIIPIERAGDAWTSFEAAAVSAMQFIEKEQMTIAQAKELGLQVVAVTFAPNGGLPAVSVDIAKY